MVGRHGRMLRLKTFSAAASGALVLAIAPAAFAQSPTLQGYSQPGGTIQQQITSAPSGTTKTTPEATVQPSPTTHPVAATTASKSSGKLPFTGLDIALLLAAAGVLLGLGFGLRRISRPPEAA
jgi:hypothetical protein